jgi:gamma-glutamylcyclotransferase (GGCT)/AIG2-like uncharacterized protein YtfP
MKRTCPGHRLIATAELRKHRLAFTRRSTRSGTGVADIVAAPGESVWGVLYELDDRHLATIDLKEGNGWAYQRRVFTVHRSPDGSACEALAYRVIMPEQAHIAPSPTYLATILAAAEMRGLPEGYVASLAKLGAPSP